MATAHLASQAGEIQALLDQLYQKVSSLPAEQRAAIMPDLEQLRGRITALTPQQPSNGDRWVIKSIKEALSKNDSKYEELADSFTDPLAVFDVNLRLIYRNKAAEVISGISNEQALGKTFEELYPKLLDSEVYLAYQRAVETRQNQTYVNHWQNPVDGTDCYFEVKIYPGREWVVAISEDVTDRENAVAALRQTAGILSESEERFRTVWEITTDAMALSDPDGTVIAANPAYCALYGYPLEEVVGHNFAIIFPEAEREYAQQQYQEVFRSAQVPPRFISTVQCKQGGACVVETHITFIEKDGQRQAMLSVIQNITERARAEEELRRTSEILRESEERFRTMADGTPVMIWVHNAEGAIEFVNRSWVDYFGVSLETAKETGWTPLVHKEDIPGYVDVFIDCMQEHKPFRAQARVRHADGTWRWIDSQGQPRFSESGAFLGMAGSSLDITERKQAEAEREQLLDELRRQKDLLKRLIDFSPVGISVLHGPDYRFAMVNQAQQKLFPTIPGFAGRTVAEIWPDQTGVFTPVLDRVFQTGEPFYAVDAPWQTDKGSGLEPVYYSYSYTPLYTSSGTIDGILVLSMETTEQVKIRQRLETELEERKRMETALSESEEKFRSAFENAAIGFAMTDQDNHFVDANAAYCALTGYSIEELRQYAFYQLVHPDDLSQNLQMNERMITGEISDYVIENRYIRKDGQVVWVKKSISLVRSADGAPKWYIALVEDITEGKRAHEAMRSSEEKFAKAFQSGPVALSITRLSDGKYLEVNDSLCRLLGYSREELLGQTPVDVGAYKDIKERDAFIRRLREKGSLRDEERTLLNRHGMLLTALMSFEPIEIAGEICLLATMMDITERKRAEDALATAHNDLLNERSRLLAVMEALPIGLAIYDEKGGVLQANPGFEAVWGSPRPPANSVDDYDLYKAWWVETGQRVRPEEWAAARAVQHGETVTGQYIQIQKFDGTQGYVLNSGAPVRSASGKVIGGAVAIMDITKRKQAEDALEKAHQALISEHNRLLAIMEALPIGVSIQDTNGAVILHNRTFEELWGGAIPATASITDYRMFRARWADSGQELKPEEWAGAVTIQNGETVREQFLQIERFDGKNAFILNSGAPIRDAAGTIIGSVVAEMDITRLIETENALRESQARFRVALASVPLLVYTCDREQRYTWVYNPLNGFRTEDVLGKRDDEVLPPGAAVEMMAAKQQALNSGQGGVHEVKVPFDGIYKYYILTTDPIRSAQGEVTGLTCSAIDITEQKHLQIAREEAEMRMEVQRRLMEYREKERQEIARDLHDGPIQLLSGTIFHLQVAKEAVQDPVIRLDLEQAAMTLKGAVRELRETMNELRPPAIIRFGLAKSIRMYGEDYKEKHPEIKLSLNLFEDGSLLPEPVRLALFRILQESLNNIAKHADASRVWVRLARKSSEVHLQIRDNGKGFTVPTDLVWQTQRGHYGMAGMKERAEAIGGVFTVTSEPGKGTTTLVTVPVPG